MLWKQNQCSSFDIMILQRFKWETYSASMFYEASMLHF